MSRFPRFASFGFAACLLASAPAFAHVRMSSPTPRYPEPAQGESQDKDIKDGPCGRVGDSRTTDMTRITEFEPGETITVTFRETIDHPGHYRIAFDEDGQDDFPDPPTSMSSPRPDVLLDSIPDESRGNYSVEVTLPDVECENCTLQLIQVMAQGQQWTSYFTCADIVLRRPGSGGSGGMPGSSGAAGSTAAGNGGLSGQGGGTNGGGTSAGGTDGAAGSGASGGSTSTAGSGGMTTGGTTGTAGSGGTPGTSGSSSIAGTGATTAGSGSGGGGQASGAAGTATAGTAPAGEPAVPPDDAGGCRMSGSRRTGAGLSALFAAALAFGIARRTRRRRS